MYKKKNITQLQLVEIHRVRERYFRGMFTNTNTLFYIVAVASSKNDNIGLCPLKKNKKKFMVGLSFSPPSPQGGGYIKF
jgi:hypothetical protein